MEYIIALFFDPISQIDDTIVKLGKTINPFMTEHHIESHVSLLRFKVPDHEDRRRTIGHFLEIQPGPVVLRTQGIGHFLDDMGTVFIDIAKDNELMKLHKKYLRFPDAMIDEQTLSENYHPHLTLATHLTPEETEQALESVKDLHIPKTLTPTSVVLLEPEMFSSLATKRIRRH